jgi:hypothetical protein
MNTPNGVCPSGKTGSYPDERSALAGLAEVRAINALYHPRRQAPTRVYECDLCPCWHLTSQPPRKPGAAA